MDTTEQLNGTYFFDGMLNLTAGELAFWIVLDEASKQLRVSNVFHWPLLLVVFP